MSAKIPITTVASANTLPNISPIAKESSCFFTALRENNNSGIVVPTPITIIPINIGLMPMASAIAIPDCTAKWAPHNSIAILPTKYAKFFRRFPEFLISLISLLFFLLEK